MPLIHAVELGQQLLHFNNDFVSRDFKLGQDFCQSNDIKTANLQFFLKYVQLTPHIYIFSGLNIVKNTYNLPASRCLSSDLCTPKSKCIIFGIVSVYICLYMYTTTKITHELL